MVNWRVVPVLVVAGGLLLWAFGAWFDRQEWIPDSEAAKIVDSGRLKCDQVGWAWVDPKGKVFPAKPNDLDALKAALEECARANMGPGVAPFNWSRFMIASVVGLAVASGPWLFSRLTRRPPRRSP